MKIKIDQPCDENWDKMSLREKGRYCQACSKIVLDMTKYSDQEIIDFFQNKKYNVCGQFDETQLDRVLVQKFESKSNKLKKGFLAASMAGIVMSSHANEFASKKAQIEFKEQEQPTNSDAIELKRNEITIIFNIKGKVQDRNGKPLKGVAVYLKDHKVTTDKNGNYEIYHAHYETEPLEISISFSFKGMDYKKVKLSLNFDQTEVDMGAITLYEERCIRKGKVRIED